MPPHKLNSTLELTYLVFVLLNSYKEANLIDGTCILTDKEFIGYIQLKLTLGFRQNNEFKSLFICASLIPHDTNIVKYVNPSICTFTSQKKQEKHYKSILGHVH